MFLSTKNTFTSGLLPLFAFFCFLSISLSLTGCGLFNNLPEADLEKKMDETIAWAKAARITVTVVYPQEWGSSPQNGTDRCLDNKHNETPRKGYDFDVQFNPNPAYGDAQWQAYLTDDLPEDNNWYINTTSINETLKDKTPLGPDKVSFSPEIGNISTVVSGIGGAITIIPRSQMQPRVVMSNPPLYASGDNFARDPNREITVTFAAPINATTLKFDEGFIEITGKWLDETRDDPIGIDGDMSDYFITPLLYDSDTYMLTIESKGDIPEGLIIEVKLGAEIKSSGSGSGMAQPVVFSYRTEVSALAIDSWQAVYDDENERIEVHWEVPASAGSAQPAARLRVNNQGIIPITQDSENSLIIDNVSAPDYSGVRDGRPIVGINSYTIYLDLGDDSTAIKLWNIPGMKVQRNWNNEDDLTVVEITSESDFQALSTNVNSNDDYSLNRIFVLTKNITLNTEWTPIGTAAAVRQFKGKFYGNGHTVTIGSGFAFADAAYTGIFGYVSGDADSAAKIRDLTVLYDTDVSAGSGASYINIYIGGLAGRIDGNTVVSNTIVKGEGKLSATSSTAMYAGAMTGYLENTVLIENGYTDIELSVTGTGNGFIRAGGITGYISEGGTTGALMIDRVTVAGIVDAGNTHTNNTGYILVGGLAGESRGHGIIQNVKVSASVRMMASNNYSNDANVAYICGGIIGRMKDGFLLSSDFTGRVEISDDYKVIVNTWIGGVVGVVGQIWGDYTIDTVNSGINQKPVLIENSTASGDIDITVQGPGRVFLGGVCGEPLNNLSSTDNIIQFENCEYRDGSIRFERRYTETQRWDTILYVGGFAGYIDRNAKLKNCGNRARLVEVIINEETTGTSEICVGGFTGISRDSIEGCYSTSPVEVNVSKTKSQTRQVIVYAGGFVGYFYTAYGGSNIQYWPDKKISGSYSSGSVTATVNLSDPFRNTVPTELYAGGFIGKTDFCVWIEDCYALGNVTVDYKGGPTGTNTNPDKIFAGGFMGSVALLNTGYWVERCFSAGSVSAAVNAASNTTLYAGAFAGNKEKAAAPSPSTDPNNDASGGLLRNCAALGGAVTVKGSAAITPELGRISGNAAANLSNNFASASMRLENGAYGDLNPTAATPPLPDATLNGKNGLSVADSTFYGSQSFWTNTAAGSGLGFDASLWSFSNLVSRGYPLLLDDSGRLLGGQ